MPLDINLLPSHLRAGGVLPKEYNHIVAELNAEPRYKIVAMSRDKFSSRYRLIHLYYVSANANDPSRIRKTMSEFMVPESSCFENGKRIEGLVGFKAYLSMGEMVQFNSLIKRIVGENKDAYNFVPYTNVVQYSSQEEVVAVYFR